MRKVASVLLILVFALGAQACGAGNVKANFYRTECSDALENSVKGTVNIRSVGEYRSFRETYNFRETDGDSGRYDETFFEEKQLAARIYRDTTSSATFRKYKSEINGNVLTVNVKRVLPLQANSDIVSFWILVEASVSEQYRLIQIKFD